MAFKFGPLETGWRTYAIRQAADGNKGALDYLLRYFIRRAQRGEPIDPEDARVVAGVLERVLVGEDIGEILGSKARRGRPCSYEKAILVHAAVRSLMLRRQLPGRTHRRGDDAKEAAAEALDMSIETVRENYKRVSRLIKKIKDDPFFDLERKGFSLIERAYLRDQENAFLLDLISGYPASGMRTIRSALDRIRWTEKARTVAATLKRQSPDGGPPVG